MLNSRKGQSIIEYTVIAILIMTAILFGGPVLMNSIRAFFKSSSDNVQDSFEERMTQADDNFPVSCVCNPEDDDPLLWPKGACGESPCAVTERHYRRNCHPIQCRQESECISEAGCCTQPVAVKCGTLVNLPHEPRYNQCLGRASYDSTKFPGGDYQGTCLANQGSVIADSQNCGIGERLYYIECGSEDGTIVRHQACKTLTTDECLPACKWNSPHSGAKPCTSASNETNRSLLAQEVAYRLLGVYNTPTGTYVQDSPPRGLQNAPYGTDGSEYMAWRVSSIAFSSSGLCSGSPKRRCEYYSSCSLNILIITSNDQKDNPMLSYFTDVETKNTSTVKTPQQLEAGYPEVANLVAYLNSFDFIIFNVKDANPQPAPTFLFTLRDELYNWVQSGGSMVVLGGYGNTYNSYTNVYLAPFGISVSGTSTGNARMVDWLNNPSYPYLTQGLCKHFIKDNTHITCPDCVVFARADSTDPDPNKNLGVVKNVGQGKIMVWADEYIMRSTVPGPGPASEPIYNRLDFTFYHKKLWSNIFAWSLNTAQCYICNGNTFYRSSAANCNTPVGEEGWDYQEAYGIGYCIFFDGTQSDGQQISTVIANAPLI
jgi:Flp pilus assembly pilin Flp